MKCKMSLNVNGHEMSKVMKCQTCKYYSFHTRTAPDLPITAGVGLGFWVVPSSHMLKTEFPCGKGFFGATIRDIGYQLDSQWDLSHPTFNLSLIVVRVDGCQPKGSRFDSRAEDPKGSMIASTLCSTLLESAFHARQTLTWPRI